MWRWNIALIASLSPFTGYKEGKTFQQTQLRIHLSTFRNDHNIFFVTQWINSMLYPWHPPPKKLPSPPLLCGFPTAYTFFFFLFIFLYFLFQVAQEGGRAGKKGGCCYKGTLASNKSESLSAFLLCVCAVNNPNGGNRCTVTSHM